MAKILVVQWRHAITLIQWKECLKKYNHSMELHNGQIRDWECPCTGHTYMNLRYDNLKTCPNCGQRYMILTHGTLKTCNFFRKSKTVFKCHSDIRRYHFTQKVKVPRKRYQKHLSFQFFFESTSIATEVQDDGYLCRLP